MPVCMRVSTSAYLLHVIRMPVEIADRRDARPLDGRMPGFEGLRETTRGFRNDLQRPRDGIAGLPVTDIRRQRYVRGKVAERLTILQAIP